MNLESQLDALRKKQAEEIDAVLTKEQLEKVTALREEANSKKKKSTPKKADSAKSDTAKAATN